MVETNVREYIGELVKRAKAAQKEFEKTYTDQAKIDEVVRAIGKTIYDNRSVLAKEACEETQYGTVKMKESKIVATTTSQWNIMRGKKSVGYIKNLRDEPGVKVMAKPMGVIGCVMPSTNPIITIAANGMMSIKCRNACMLVNKGHATLGVSKQDYKIISSVPRTTAPFADSEKTVWISPILVCTVKYMEKTASGMLRQPVFKGLRDDKAPTECQMKL